MEGDIIICVVPELFQISIHSLRVEGDLIVNRVSKRGKRISIHSLRVEGDKSAVSDISCRRCISIHSLRVEGDYNGSGISLKVDRFQSTPSVWRET